MQLQLVQDRLENSFLIVGQQRDRTAFWNVALSRRERGPT